MRWTGAVLRIRGNGDVLCGRGSNSGVGGSGDTHRICGVSVSGSFGGVCSDGACGLDCTLCEVRIHPTAIRMYDGTVAVPRPLRAMLGRVNHSAFPNPGRDAYSRVTRRESGIRTHVHIRVYACAFARASNSIKTIW